MHTKALNHPRNQALMRQIKQAKPAEIKYPDNAVIEADMQKLHDHIFNLEVDEHGRHACMQIAKGFTYVIPYVDKYLLDMERCFITDDHLAKYCKGWNEAPVSYQNKLRKAATIFNGKVKKSLLTLREFVNRQAFHLNELSDEKAEKVMQLEETEIEVQVSTDLRSYLQPAPKESKYLLPAQTIAQNLALYSKGLIYYSPSEVARELTKRGFTKGTGGYYVQEVRG